MVTEVGQLGSVSAFYNEIQEGRTEGFIRNFRECRPYETFLGIIGIFLPKIKRLFLQKRMAPE